MSWYVTAGKILWTGAKAVAAHKGVQSVLTTVGSAVLMDRLVTKAKEERERKRAGRR